MSQSIKLTNRLCHHESQISDSEFNRISQTRNRVELSLKQTLRSRFSLDSEQKQDILESIFDYTTRVPLKAIIWNKHSAKKCIEEAVFTDAEFNPYHVKEAFQSIEDMLINLIQFPWHNEFRKIFIYSGHFRHHLCDSLNNIEDVLKSAGYQVSTDCPMHLILPSVRLPEHDNGECVANTIFDCYIAQALCCELIDVFENSCRRIKMLAIRNYCDHVNSYPWLKKYFTMRLDYDFRSTLDNLDELFCDLSSHLSRLDLRLQGETNMEAMDRVDTSGGTKVVKQERRMKQSRDSSLDIQINQNDTDPLLPRYDRKSSPSYGKNIVDHQINDNINYNCATNNSKKNGVNHYKSLDITPTEENSRDSYAITNNNYLGSSTSSSQRRFYQHDNYYPDSINYHSDGPSSLSSNHHSHHRESENLNINHRYGNGHYQTNKRYDSRDLNILPNNMLTDDSWICNACSYANASFSIQCQFCRRRK